MITAYPEWWHRKQKPWNPEDIPPTPPSWWIWTGNWQDLDGDNTCLMNWPLAEDSIVVEVGAYQGWWAKRMIDRYHCHIWCIEPAPMAFGLLEKAVDHYPKAYLFNVGLWTEDGKGTMGDAERDGASLFSTDEPRVEVELVGAIRFFRENKLDKIDLLSINIEGGEYYLLPYFIKTGLIERLDRLMIQWHYCCIENARKETWRIRGMIAETHKMMWSTGAWEAWERKAQ